MPKQQKMPQSGVGGPQQTRVYAPTHRPPRETGVQRQGPQNRSAAGRTAPKKQHNSPNSLSNSVSGQAPQRTNKQKPQPEKAFDVSSHKKPHQQRAHKATAATNSRQSAYGARDTGPQRILTDKDTRRNTRDRLAEQARAQLAIQAHVPDTSRLAGHEKVKTSIENVHRVEYLGHPTAAKANREQRAERRPVDSRKLITYLIIFVAIAGLLLTGYFVFLLDTVAVDGNELYPDERIVELSGLKAGTHMLLCDTQKAKAGIETNPYLMVKSIQWELPRTIRIHMQEREEVAAIASQGYDVIIDAEGYVLSIGSGSDLSGLLRVSGMSQMGFHVNERLGANSDFQTKALLSMMEQLTALDLMGDVEEIDLSNPLNVLLYTKDGITVTCGQPENLPEKLAWMRDALPSLRAGGITQGSLDVSAKGGAIYSPAKVTPAGTMPEETPQAPTPEVDNPDNTHTQPQVSVSPDNEG